MPAGRIVAGAGADRDVTLFNCFVMGTVPDTMDGIFAHLREAALTMQQGGGIGYDFSTIRPRGAPVRGVGSDASGPVSFMDVWDSMCRTIMSAGSRRGAMMGCLRCDHPDIEEFVDAKQDAERLRMFNLSVLATDAFMQAVREDADWPLVFGGQTYRTIKARRLWDRIMRATYAAAEPGVIFIDRINQKNNLWYAEQIAATNPCVTADTWVHTSEGPRQVGELAGRAFTARIDGADWPSDPRGFFETGRKPVLRLRSTRGHELRLTVDHPVLCMRRRTRHVRETEWTTAGAIAPGDEIVLNDHRGQADWPGDGTAEAGYLIGLLLGDGTQAGQGGAIGLASGGSRERRRYHHGRRRGNGARRKLRARLPRPQRFRRVAGGRRTQRVPDGARRRERPGGEPGDGPGRQADHPAIEARGSDFRARRAGRAVRCRRHGWRYAGQGRQRPAGAERPRRPAGRPAHAAAPWHRREHLYRPPARRPRRSCRTRTAAGLYPTRAQHELVIAGENLARFSPRSASATATSKPGWTRGLAATGAG